MSLFLSLSFYPYLYSFLVLLVSFAAVINNSQVSVDYSNKHLFLAHVTCQPLVVAALAFLSVSYYSRTHSEREALLGNAFAGQKEKSEN